MKRNPVTAFVERIEEFACNLLLICMLIVTFIQIISRYVLGTPLTWSEEFARLAFVWLNLIAVSIVTRKKANVSLDLVVSYLPVKVRLVIEVVMNLLIAAALLWLFIPSIKFIKFMNSVPSAAMEWPMGVFYMGMPITIVLLCMVIIKQVTNAVEQLRNGKEGNELVK